MKISKKSEVEEVCSDDVISFLFKKRGRNLYSPAHPYTARVDEKPSGAVEGGIQLPPHQNGFCANYVNEKIRK